MPNQLALTLLLLSDIMKAPCWNTILNANRLPPIPHAKAKMLSPRQLVADFGRKAQVTGEGVRAIYAAVGMPGNGVATEALVRWQAVTGISSRPQTPRLTTAVRQLTRWLAIPTDGLHAMALVFSLQTYYALLVKALLGHIQPTLGKSARDDLFAWPEKAQAPEVVAIAERIAKQFSEYDIKGFLTGTSPSRDLLKDLYEDLFPKPLRHALGEYYTPDWLAEHVLDQAGYSGDPTTRLLDPACGSGTFLVAAINRLRTRLAEDPAMRESGKDTLCRQILDNVVGFDLNPLAVLSARANYLLALGELADHIDSNEIPVYQRDSILASSETLDNRFDYVVGNPPWIAWDDLPPEYREATKPLWEQYGLFSLSGNAARHGGGKKDLSMLMLYRAADRHLTDGGRLAMVITQTLFQTQGAGDGFRRFQLGNHGTPLRVLRVDDLVEQLPFAAANWTSTIVLEKGSPTVYPVPYVRWSGKRSRNADAQVVYEAEPIDPERPTSPWFLRPAGFQAKLATLTGPSDYQAHLGANTGGANGVFWLTLLGVADGGIRVRNLASHGRRTSRLEEVETVLEPELLYPLLRWGDVARYRAQPSAHLLLAQDPATRHGLDEAMLRQKCPRTYDYLKRFEPWLLQRAAYRRYQRQGPFYSMYDIDHYTLAPVKVVWRRMDRRINAAVVEPWEDDLLGRRAVIPQETCVLIACGCADEAHYLCALLNSTVVGFLIGSHHVRGGKGFGTPGMLNVLRLRGFNPTDAHHLQLAALSRLAHRAAADGQEVEPYQTQIDALAGRLWGLTESDLAVLQPTAAGDGCIGPDHPHSGHVRRRRVGTG